MVAIDRHTTSRNPLAGNVPYRRHRAVRLPGFGAARYGRPWSRRRRRLARAAEMVSRLSLISCSFAAMIVEPLGRLVPSGPWAPSGRERASFTLALRRHRLPRLSLRRGARRTGPRKHVGAGDGLCVLTAMILVVMSFSAHPAMERRLGASRPHAPCSALRPHTSAGLHCDGSVNISSDRTVPNVWYGFSLLLLVGVLLLRFADSFAPTGASADGEGTT